MSKSNQSPSNEEESKYGKKYLLDHLQKIAPEFFNPQLDLISKV